MATRERSRSRPTTAPDDSRWPACASEALKRTSGRRPPPFEVGWGDARTISHRTAEPPLREQSAAPTPLTVAFERAASATARGVIFEAAELSARVSAEARSQQLGEENRSLQAQLDAMKEEMAVLRVAAYDQDVVSEEVNQVRLENIRLAGALEKAERDKAMLRERLRDETAALQRAEAALRVLGMNAGRTITRARRVEV